MIGGHHSPLGWAATLLIAIAYAHVLLELAGALLVVGSRCGCWPCRRGMCWRSGLAAA